MNLTIIGYGKMGKEIEKIALERGHNVKYKIDAENADQLETALKNTDVAIEFTQPDVVENNMQTAFKVQTPIVVGTTGWNDKEERLIDECKVSNSGLFYASNFSIGVNIFFEINRYLAKIMNGFEDYEPSLVETHHIHKKDAPSGTAISLANIVVNELDRKNNWKLNQTGKDILSITAKRENEVPGTHQLIYENDIDKIEFSHIAKGRKGFAFGAVLAAEFMVGKKGVFTIKDLLKFDDLR